MEVLVTRKIQSGAIVGPQEAIDRKAALKMMTVNGAIYVGREKEIGSLEEGTWVDLAVLDRNPLDPAVENEELSEIRLLELRQGSDSRSPPIRSLEQFPPFAEDLLPDLWT